MSSLTELNNYSDNTITFTENRPYGVVLAWPTSRDLSFTVETQTFTVQRTNEIEEIITPTSALVEYEIDVSGVLGATVSWTTTPSGCNVVSSNGVFIMQGIDSISDWETVRAPLITVPDTFQGSFFYIVTIRYNTPQGIQEESWQVGTFVPVSNFISSASLSAAFTRTRTTSCSINCYFNVTSELSNAGFSGPSTFDFLKSTTQTVTGNPTIVYEGGDGTEIWTVTVTPSTTTIVDTMSSSGSGGTSSFNSTSKVLTLTGTETQVESHLNSISLTTTSTKSDAFFTYAGSNDDDPGITYTVRQTLNCLNLDYLTEPRGSATYTTSTASNICLDGPQIYDIDYTASGNYTLTLTPSVTSQVQNITSTGISGWGAEQEYTYTASSTGALLAGAYGSSNSVLVIGNAGDDTNTTNGGALHWFIKTGQEYSLVKTVFGSNYYANLGRRIIMADDDTILSSGMYYNAGGDINDPIGRVFVYERGVGNTWSLAQTLSPPGNNTDAFFGQQMSCSRDGDTLAIAEPTDTDTGENREGRVHIYTRTGTGNYSRQTTILDPDTDYSSSFGWAQCRLSSDGTRLAITDGLGDNDTYYYTGSGSTWTLDEKVANTTRYSYFTQDGTRYLYGDGTNLYVMTRGTGSAPQTYTQTTSFTPSSSFYEMKASDDGTAVVIKLVNSSSDFDFIRIEFDESTNTFTEDRTIDLSSYLNTIYDWQLNLDGSEVIGTGINSNNDMGFVTYTDGPKPGTFDSVAKTYQVIGSKTDVNNDIDTITLTSSSISNIELTYTIETPETNTEDKIVTITNAG
ncbi:hypothetical protein OAP44_02990 [Candidatus Pelagibacter sp.]|nr:hypothetical protein [Candidatus Pelagibacter sp.]